MNIQPGKSSERKSIRQSSPDHSGVEALCNLLARVGQTALLVFIVGAFFHTYIRVDQEINGASAEIERIDRQIKQVDREIAAFEMDYANCTTREFIDRQIANFKLPLYEIRLDQQRRIRLYTNEELARMPLPVRNDRRMAIDNRRSEYR